MNQSQNSSRSSCQSCTGSPKIPAMQSGQFMQSGRPSMQSGQFMQSKQTGPSPQFNQSGGGSACLTPPVGEVTAKFQPASYPIDESFGTRLGCYDQACPTMDTTANLCYVKSRNYIQPWTERPSYYLDLTQPFVGGRPVRQAHNVNAIPRTLRYDSANLSGREFHCQQPCWGSKCL